MFVPSPPVAEEDDLFSDNDGIIRPRECMHYMGSKEMKDSGKPDSPEPEFDAPQGASRYTPIPAHMEGAAAYSYQDSGRPSSGGSDRPGSGNKNEESRIPDWLKAVCRDVCFSSLCALF